MKSKRKLIISILVAAFVMLSVVAAVSIAFALTQQTVKSSLNIGYNAEDIDGSVSATYSIGGGASYFLDPSADLDHISEDGRSLLFKASDKESAGNLLFPEDGLTLDSQNDNVVIQYTYTNTGSKHYIATMDFDADIHADNMKVEYSINGRDYFEQRYAVVVPANTSNRSYWIKISIENKSKDASFKGDFNWLLKGCDTQSEEYLSIPSYEFQATENSGEYKVSIANSGAYGTRLVIPRSINGDEITTIAKSGLTPEQKSTITSVCVPDSITTIGESAFEGFANLETLTLKQYESAGASAQSNTGLTTIGANAFKNCVKLDNLVIPDGITDFDNTAFTGCSGLKNITYGSRDCVGLYNALWDLAETYGGLHFIIPEGVTYFGGLPFSGSCGLTKITLPNSLKTIGETAFLAFFGLTSIIIPDGVTAIEDRAFELCGLTSIVIPKNVTSIGEGAFKGCPLGSIVVEEGNSNYHSAGNCLIETATKKLIAGSETSVIPTDDSVTSIGAYAFYYSGITNLEIPNNITSIGASAFNGSRIRNIVIPDSVTGTLINTFAGCPDLTSVVIGENVTKMVWTFECCYQLTSVVIGKNVANMEGTFESCWSLTSVTFRNTDGWFVNEDPNATSGTPLDPEDLSNTSTAATYLTSTYAYVYWKCNK